MCAPDELTFMITIGYVNVDMRELYSPVRFLLMCCSVSWLLTISENKLVEKEETPACSKYHSSSHLIMYLQGFLTYSSLNERWGVWEENS